MQLIAVVLAAPTSKERFGAASGLLDYGFANYSVNKAVSEGEEIEKVPVLKGVENEIAVVAEKNCSILLSKGKQSEIERKIELPETLSAPVSKGEIVGKIEFLLDGEVKDSVNLITNKDIVKKNYISFLCDTLRQWISCEK